MQAFSLAGESVHLHTRTECGLLTVPEGRAVL
jgi:hypothetical protein